MWLVTKDGFFNIVRDTKDKNVLTVKARRWEDIFRVVRATGVSTAEIEKSMSADYRFRVRIPVDSVARYISGMVKDINYPKTKPMLEIETPGRNRIYLEVWDTLSELQDE